MVDVKNKRSYENYGIDVRVLSRGAMFGTPASERQSRSCSFAASFHDDWVNVFVWEEIFAFPESTYDATQL